MEVLRGGGFVAAAEHNGGVGAEDGAQGVGKRTHKHLLIWPEHHPLRGSPNKVGNGSTRRLHLRNSQLLTNQLRF